MSLAEIWLNIPQAVVLEATGDLVQARALDASDPDLLVIKATWLLPPLGAAPVDAGASAAQPRGACRRRMGEGRLPWWYEKRVLELIAQGEAASGEADWDAAKRQFSGRVTRARLRAMRDQLAPADWKRQGRRSVKAE